MPLNVDLNKSSPNLFTLVFPMIPYQQSIKESSELVLNVFGSVIPGISLGDASAEWQGFKTPFATSPLAFDNWTIDFSVDKNFRNWRMLLNWIFYINDNNEKHMEPSDDYMIDASLIVMAPFRKPILTIDFKHVWPLSLGAITMNMRDGMSQLDCNVTLAYSRFEIASIDSSVRLSDL